jgi:hypothetical protein
MDNNNVEKCVSCIREVGYTINTHIDIRKNYVEGVGQLCSECFIEVYNKVHKKNVDIDEES